MADLAERVGLRKASLFHHFASKDVLYATVIEQLMGLLSEVVQNGVRADGTFEERLDAMTDAITMALASQPYAARILIREVIDWGPVLQNVLGTTILSVLEGAYEFARAAQKADAFVDLEAKQVIVSLIGACFFHFAAAGVVEAYTGSNPFQPAAIEERRKAIRDQVRFLVLKRAPA